MKYKLVKETKPRLSTFGKYKAKAVHNEEVGENQIMEEAARRLGVDDSVIHAVLLSLSHVINAHLRHGDKVRLNSFGMMKLEIESDKVDAPEDFKPRKHIRGVRLHILPASETGKPELYQDLKFEKAK